MAELTLSEKSLISTKEAFHLRMKAAIKKESGYWLNNNPSVIGDYNAERQKRKRFAKAILDGGSVNTQSVCDYFLMLYTNASPDLDEDGIPNDAAIQSLMTTVFDYFAGVTSDDASDKIVW